jgi:dihydroorotate dehydrogenase (NAD+) catalytic subunit
MVEISVTVAGLSLKNPTMMASGILGETGESLLSMAKHGCGALVTKSIGMEPKEGHKNPTFFETPYSVLNAMGLPNPGIEEYGAELKRAREAEVPVIGSIFGKDADEFKALAQKMEQYGADAVELNLSCPHAKGYGAELGHDPQKVLEITKAVKEAVGIPVFAKLSPNVSNISEIAKAVEKAQGDGIVAINTIKAIAINAHLAQPVLANVKGGLSGPAIKPVGLRCVYEIKENTAIPIIGVGGIQNGLDAVEYIMAGADAVQVGSGIHFRGKGIFKEICKEITEFMKENGYSKIKEMVGIAHRR